MIWIELWVGLTISLVSLFVSDLEGFAVKIDTLQQELIVVFSEVEVHLGDSLVFCAEKKPKLISGDVSRYLQSFPWSDCMLSIEGDLFGHLYGVLDPLLDEQVKMDL